MRFVSVRELRGQSAAVWKALAEEKDLVVTSNGRPIALLSATSDETLEEWPDLRPSQRASSMPRLRPLARHAMRGRRRRRNPSGVRLCHDARILEGAAGVLPGTTRPDR